MLAKVTAAVILIVCAQALPSSEDLANRQKVKTPRFDIEERIARDGYFSESHCVTTSDGYILEMNRIPYGKYEKKGSSSERRPVVFLMHGLHNSAIAYITLGAGQSIAYILADAGYDVWMGNARGVVNSRRHLTLDPDDYEDRYKFFDYTFEDIALKDLPAMLDYVLEYTANEQLNYIGHSQGGTAFLVLNSRRPEYNKIFKTVNLLAAVGYQRYFPTKALRVTAQRTDSIYTLAVRTGSKEIGPTQRMGDNYNENNLDINEYALTSLDEFMDVPVEILAGASIKQYAHYGQNIRDQIFRSWNYGTLGNLCTYGSIYPPAYDLSLVSAEITMHYSVSDILLDERDVLDMASVMPNTKVRRVDRDCFTHTDFIIAPDSKSLVTDYILEELNKKNK
ncbi:jg22045 [Pararge aegeria aegeria]|uniref:Lipase n=1 Tax=Pararge aegeria aegeria TaxID=348720 RepID=A0A8S4RIB9_9NEOP|nr:jg22045 [Pararge aegeria aegeria]